MKNPSGEKLGKCRFGKTIARGKKLFGRQAPDLNACENLGAILKDRVESRQVSHNETLETALQRSLGDLEFDTELFCRLLQSYPARLDAVRKAGGRHTKY